MYMWSSEAGRRTQLFAQDEQVAGVTYTYTVLQKPSQNKTSFLTDLKSKLIGNLTKSTIVFTTIL
ncbi:hypothetical protein AN2V17_23200 [Vallitalea sp. AN17-2]|uniref:Uncharacterized protein n=1 Tax=Vallitalea maricola TaxID=3074433 RepID=A0ACB5UJG3_9FIRM|nr:hypothetical protein AN2V17_23200 [Vallitalea sp. AN17-2]